jgi:hypothetical protein
MDLKRFVVCLSVDEQDELARLLLNERDKRNQTEFELKTHNLVAVRLWGGGDITPLNLNALANWYTGWGDKFRPEIGVSEYTRNDLSRIRGIGTKGLDRIIQHQRKKGPQFRDV